MSTETVITPVKDDTRTYDEKAKAAEEAALAALEDADKQLAFNFDGGQPPDKTGGDDNPPQEDLIGGKFKTKKTS